MTSTARDFLIGVAPAPTSRHYALVDATLDYARAVATPDVRDALDWLTRNGFRVVSSRGGRTESFGNVLLELESDIGEVIAIVRDRSQWMCELAPAGGDPRPIHTLLTAMTGADPTPSNHNPGEPSPSSFRPAWLGYR